MTKSANLKIMFKILDYDNDGSISMEDLNDVFCTYSGRNISAHLWNEFLQEANCTDDGSISS